MSVRAYIEPGKIPPAVKELLETLRRGGFAAYPVGGAVRDLLLGKQPHDWDVTTNALPWQSEELLQSCRVIETGVQPAGFYHRGHGLECRNRRGHRSLWWAG